MAVITAGNYNSAEGSRVSEKAFWRFVIPAETPRIPSEFTKHRDPMIRKLKSGEYRLYSRKKDPKTGKRKNLGTFKSRAEAERHERAVQFFKRRG